MVYCCQFWPQSTLGTTTNYKLLLWLTLIKHHTSFWYFLHHPDIKKQKFGCESTCNIRGLLNILPKTYSFLTLFWSFQTIWNLNFSLLPNHGGWHRVPPLFKISGSTHFLTTSCFVVFVFILVPHAFHFSYSYNRLLSYF